MVVTYTENSTSCGLPSWIGIIRNDTIAYINDILLATVNVPCAIFAFLSNLAIIVTVIKKPSLQKPCNILLCSLAFADCFTGVTSQPMFVAWRFFLQKAHRSCSHQVLIFKVYYIFNAFTVGLSFANAIVISFDRYYALSRPLAYRANATKEGAVKAAIFANSIWLLCIILMFTVGYFVSIICAVLFLVVPTVNYVRMLFAIRRHNSQLGDAVASQQGSAVLNREKKVALDMCIVAILLLSSLTPFVITDIIAMLGYPRLHSIILPWSLTMGFMMSCINPLFYVWRNTSLRNAVKSMLTPPA